MSLSTSKTILKIFGIISIVLGVLGIIAGVIAVAGGAIVGAGAASGEIASTSGLAAGIALLGFGGLIILVMAVIELLSGIFSVRAAKDISKIMPAWVFALLGLISAVINVVSLFVGQTELASTSSIVGTVIGCIINILIFVAANTIKTAANK